MPEFDLRDLRSLAPSNAAGRVQTPDQAWRALVQDATTILASVRESITESEFADAAEKLTVGSMAVGRVLGFLEASSLFDPSVLERSWPDALALADEVDNLKLLLKEHGTHRGRRGRSR